MFTKNRFRKFSIFCEHFRFSKFSIFKILGFPKKSKKNTEKYFVILFFDTFKKYFLFSFFFVTRYGNIVCKNNNLHNPQARKQRTARHITRDLVKKSCIFRIVILLLWGLRSGFSYYLRVMGPLFLKSFCKEVNCSPRWRFRLPPGFLWVKDTC